MSILSEPLLVVPCPADYHEAVSEFKRRLIEVALREARGNRTHAARVLGLQRTYLLRLMRDLNVMAPPPPERRRRVAEHNARPPAA
jgi:DNA-binding NtrC family response regulator